MATNGDCYEANGRFFMKSSISPNQESGWWLCHGTVTGQSEIEGLKYGHCWIEKGSRVLDVSNGNNINLPKDAYYRLGQIDSSTVRRYDSKKFRKFILDTEHWGPWEPVIGSDV